MNYASKELKATVKKIFIGIVGGLVLLIGVVMIVLPGPAVLVIPAGLAILATEFQWAHNLKERFKHKFQEWRDKHRAQKEKRRSASLIAPKVP